MPSAAEMQRSMSAPEISMLRLCDEIASAVGACDRVTQPGLECPTIAALRETPAILADVWPATAVSGVRLRLLRVQRHLLHMVISEAPVDGVRACRVLQHLYADSAVEWAPRVAQLAAEIGAELPQAPRDASSGAPLRDL